MGGVQYVHLDEKAKVIWNWCENRRIWIHAEYIASEENIEADQESRYRNIDTEWQLAPDVFEEIISQFGKPEIDLYASRANTKCDRFCSWGKDPDAVAIDAFRIDWNDIHFYAFSPFSMILRTLTKIIHDRAQGIVVVPLWSA
ncbi:reverse transcriptase and recombinase [Lasius niger]|uniref:Reverse transcriptase and recombinase n=1 Tax=Lasius niger TaxID=67767 RepID=A0A0J7K6W6_LASNI|nr:reverse transcriptase and recombinase [Lasius niger]KMQ86231.1 reverse transcriptase and recombinase [Lasius niger]